MTASDSSNPLERFTHHVRRRWGWFLALGIIYLIGGIAAIFLPVMSSIAFTIVIASFLVVGGIVQIIQSFQMNGWQGVVWHLLMGIITLVGGGYALWNPIAGALAITLVIAITFIAQGVVEIESHTPASSAGARTRLSAPGVRTPGGAKPRRGASEPRPGSAASSATGSRSAGCARASR